MHFRLSRCPGYWPDRSSCPKRRAGGGRRDMTEWKSGGLSRSFCRRCTMDRPLVGGWRDGCGRGAAPGAAGQRYMIGTAAHHDARSRFWIQLTTRP